MTYYTSLDAEILAMSLARDAKEARDMPPTYKREIAPVLREARDMLNEALNEMQEAA